MYHCLIKIQLQTIIKIMSYIENQVTIGICFDERRVDARVVREREELGDGCMYHMLCVHSEATLFLLQNLYFKTYSKIYPFVRHIKRYQ